MAKTKEALKILEKVTGSEATMRGGVAKARINLEVAQMIYDARTKAGLSQQALAALVGSRQSVIARLEDADYEGHSLSMLQRIGNAVGRHLQLRFVRATSPRRHVAAQSTRPKPKRVLRQA